MKLLSFICQQYSFFSTKDTNPTKVYKQKQFLDAIEHDALLVLIADWLYELEDNSSLLNDERYKSHFNAFKDNLPSLATQNHTDFVKECDAYYIFFCQSLQNELSIQSQNKPFLAQNLKYVDQNGAGVYLKVYYSEQENNQREIGPLLEGGLALKNARQKNEVASQLVKQFNGLGFKAECLGNLKHHISDNKHFHAEERWFGEYFLPWISTLGKQKLEPFMLEEYDLQWLWHLNSYPRVEFYLSSSPCEHCRVLFTEMRKQLNQRDIHIPILIYYIKPFLTEEVSKSQILLVSFDAKIIETNICLQTSYDNNVDRQLINYQKYIDSKRACILDPYMYKVVSAMLSENNPWGFQKIHYGLKTLVRDNHNSADLAWLLTFFERIPRVIQDENLNELALIKSDILQIFKTGKFNQKYPNNDLLGNIKHLIDLWVSKDNNTMFITYVIFDQLKALFKHMQPNLESTKLVIMLITSLVMTKLFISRETYNTNSRTFRV